MTVSIFDRLTNLVGQIQALGINATMDPRDTQIPGALVDLDSLGDDDTLCGDLSATATVWLVVPDHDHPTALAELLEMYDLVAHLSTGADTAELVLPDLPPLPALKLNPIDL